jgi:hypothetical protein
VGGNVDANPSQDLAEARNRGLAAGEADPADGVHARGQDLAGGRLNEGEPWQVWRRVAAIAPHEILAAHGAIDIDARFHEILFHDRAASGE